jgi:hypothetical protein
MTDETPRVDREGIHIDRELAERVAIEEELDSNVAGEYRFPSPARRRISGWVFVVFGVVAALSFDGGWLVSLGFLVLALWQFLSAWPLNVDEKKAMTVAATAVDFPVGHSSAAVRFRGWRSRPRWSIVLYSATEPPDRRALVVVDAVDGAIVETPYLEDVIPV